MLAYSQPKRSNDGAAEPNPKARYRNPNVSLSALISSNWQCEDRESAHAEDKTTASA